MEYMTNSVKYYIVLAIWHEYPVSNVLFVLQTVRRGSSILGQVALGRLKSGTPPDTRRRA